MSENEGIIDDWILKLILFGLRNLLTLQHIDVINELFVLRGRYLGLGKSKYLYYFKCLI